MAASSISMHLQHFAGNESVRPAWLLTSLENKIQTFMSPRPRLCGGTQSAGFVMPDIEALGRQRSSGSERGRAAADAFIGPHLRAACAR